MVAVRLELFSRRARVMFVPVGLLVALGGCGKVCSDDGFAWQQDPACLALLTASESTPSTGVESESATDPTDSTPTSGGGDGLYCADKDGDGFGDPASCTEVPPGDTPPPGSVPNDDDCDDASGDTFPGSAPKDSETACMKDGDGDDWGDSVPPGGGGGGGGGPVPGSDCDDAGADTFPGSAPNDSATACMKDEDGDDWGDDSPPGGGGPGGVMPGTDCNDADLKEWSACGTCVDIDGDGAYTGCDSYPPEFPTADCDDADPNTFPGAAPNDDADACMTDADGDDWGDSMPTAPDAVPGTDCDDMSADTFPGSAPLDDATACMKDADGDDHGDARPDKPGVVPGNDCNDAESKINPSVSVLITAPITTGAISEVDLASGSVTPIAMLDVAAFNPWIPTSVAINPVDQSVFAALAFNDKLVTMNYCGGGKPTALPLAHKKNLCGIGFDRTGKLYGIDGQVDQLVTFKPDGSIDNVKPLKFNGVTLNVAECGMTYDCHQDRLLVSDSGSGGIYVVNTADGTTTRIADVPDGMFGSGLAYEPVSKRALSCLGTSFMSIALDGTDAFTQLPDLASPADDLDYAPACQ